MQMALLLAYFSRALTYNGPKALAGQKWPLRGCPSQKTLCRTFLGMGGRGNTGTACSRSCRLQVAGWMLPSGQKLPAGQGRKS